MRILLIEDEAKVAGFIKRGLVAERYAVDVCADGTEGLEFAMSFQYDLIILDLMLPGLDGTTLLKRIRAVDSKVPALILTARDSVQDKVNNFEAGADDYLTKPFAFAELQVRVKALLRRGPVNHASTVRLGRKTYRPHNQRICLAGISYVERWTGALSKYDHRARLGRKLRRPHKCRGRLHPPP